MICILYSKFYIQSLWNAVKAVLRKKFSLEYILEEMRSKRGPILLSWKTR